ncbi:MAG: hypothetical protein SZ59_C0005G0055 [candidate division TM6 bacterium GW2011_GWF2_28_16]|nr:MAG: hypothetical protein SZ59_C0005G0055 [candidate division TM6 bacterium GW2011_GWF2_28_16]
MCKIKFITNLIYSLFIVNFAFTQIALKESTEKYIETQKDYLKKIDTVAEKIRLSRNLAHENYQNKVDKPLDELLLKISSGTGAFQSSSRFNLESETIKPEYLTELEGIKNKSNEIDLLEDKVLAKLSEIDAAAAKAAECAIKSRELKLGDIDNINDIMLNENIEKLKNYLTLITDILQNIENNLIKEIDKLFQEVETGINSINENLDISVKKIEQEQVNKSINQDKIQEPFALEIVKQEQIVQDVSLYIKIKIYLKNITIKTQDLFKKFVQDVKNKANELKTK